MFLSNAIQPLPQVLYLHVAGKGIEDFHLLIILRNHTKHLLPDGDTKIGFETGKSVS